MLNEPFGTREELGGWKCFRVQFVGFDEKFLVGHGQVQFAYEKKTTPVVEDRRRWGPTNENLPCFQR